MSDIVIKGMEMPKKNECVIFMLSGDGSISMKLGEDYFEVGKAIELLPHGRLGDLDLMKEDFDESLRVRRQLVDLDSDSPFYGLQQRDLANAEKLVNGLIGRTPTVLEASEVKE